MDDIITVLIISVALPVVLSVVANGAAWLLMRPQKEKIKAETAKLITEAAETMIEQLSVQVKELKESDVTNRETIEHLEVAEKQNQSLIEALRRENVEHKALIAGLRDRIVALEEESMSLREGCIMLEHQVETLGEEPVWRVSRQAAR